MTRLCLPATRVSEAPTLALAAILVALTLAACGSGGGGTGGGGNSGTTAGTAAGSLTVQGGVVTVCGIAFTPSPGVTVRVDDLPSSLTGLSDGMVVKVRGTIDANHLTGIAEAIEAEDEVEGPVSSIVVADGMLTILGHAVFIDDLTVLANTSGLAGASPLAVADVVEVHGQRDSKGGIRATRVERKNPGQEKIDVKGTVSGLAGTTFNVGATVVTFDPLIAPAGLADGVPVEVEGIPTGSAAMTATAIEREDLEDGSFEPREGEKVEGEGFAHGVSSGGFVMNGRELGKTGDTVYLNGAADDLADDVRIQADGLFLNGKRTTERISFTRTRLKMVATAGPVDPGGRTVTLFTNIVHVDANTVLPVPLAGIEEGVSRLEYRGYEDADGRLVADRLVPAGGGENDMIQGRVEDESLSTFEILGITIGTASGGGGATIFRDEDGAIISSSAFYGALQPASTNPPGSLVKVTGTFGGGFIPFAAVEAELDD